MLLKFENYIQQNLAFLTKSKILIAISGGIDSVVLTHLCYQANLDFALAHANFNLRGKESDADEDFVLQLAEKLEKEVFIQSFETQKFAKNQKLSIQMAARELRYNWFQELSKQLQFNYILTAHHADDNLETFLINLSRGTGLDGLTGIPEINKNIVRPLLKFSRSEIENFAKSIKLTWREDASNANTNYIRNKWRHEVIPVLKAMNPELLENLQKTQNHLQESKSIVKDAVSNLADQVILIEGDIIKFDIAKLQKLNHTKAYLFELLKDYHFTAWNDVYNLLDAQSGKQVFSRTHRLLKDREYLLLSEINKETTSKPATTISVLNHHSKIATNLGNLYFETTNNITKTAANIVFVDKDLLKFPLCIRKWEKGDYFYPLGMQGKKKLSKFFKDEKYSILEKEKALVLCSGEDVVWLINARADNRYKVTENTKSILKITLQA